MSIGTQVALKRALDLVGATVFLVVCGPLFVLVPLAVRLSSRGPALFRQPRVGLGGVTFEVLKFRTMYEGTHESLMADEDDRRRYEENGWKLPSDDPRITSIGRWLRKTSIDELPQLWNVLRGDMSLVGVRPLLEDELERRPPHDRDLYCRMRPGITGRWQVEGRSTLPEVDRVEMDRAYVERWSLRTDLALLARTPAAVLRVHHAR